MTTYRRAKIAGGTFFFTVVTYRRRGWLCEPWARNLLRESIKSVQSSHPFRVDAWVLLPDHMHCIWTLPEGDKDYSVRWRLIKTKTTKRISEMRMGAVEPQLGESRLKRRERGVWQRRYWEHMIRDERDFAAHCDYIHYNPVKHGLAATPGEWPYSTFGRFARQGLYPDNWGGVPIESNDDIAKGE